MTLDVKRYPILVVDDEQDNLDAFRFNFKKTLDILTANSGAEANEGAIKLARKWGEKKRVGAYEIIAFDNGFHGRTLATMSASGKPQFRNLYEPKVPGFSHVAVNDIAAVDRAIHAKTVAVMLEPIQGESGIVPFSDSFLRDLRELKIGRAHV